ncbi:MAG: glycosyltransferase [Halothiobacillaceae bacterium]|nr:MAG: glycosyltransferase [Halothiobacillaceae bacterium]
MFSIIIPTWNNIACLKLCIDGIKNNSCFDHEIIVHVNEGNDGTLEWLNKAGIKYTHSTGNIGICLAVVPSRAIIFPSVAGRCLKPVCFFRPF